MAPGRPRLMCLLFCCAGDPKLKRVFVDLLLAAAAPPLDPGIQVAVSSSQCLSVASPAWPSDLCRSSRLVAATRAAFSRLHCNHFTTPLNARFSTPSRAAAQVLLLWWRIQYFARAFQQMRNTFLNTIVAVVRDVRWFLALLVITLWGFAGERWVQTPDAMRSTSSLFLKPAGPLSVKMALLYTTVK